MTACVTRPETIITAKVERMVAATYWTQAGRITPQTSKRPTAAGMNISGMISTRKVPVSRTALTLSLIHISAIEAALNPKSTDYYYYALGKDGKHHFATTLKEHNSFLNSDQYAGN